MPFAIRDETVKQEHFVCDCIVRLTNGDLKSVWIVRKSEKIPVECRRVSLHESQDADMVVVAKLVVGRLFGVPFLVAVRMEAGIVLLEVGGRRGRSRAVRTGILGERGLGYAAEVHASFSQS